MSLSSSRCSPAGVPAAKFDINRIGEAAETRLDRRRDIAIGAAGGEQPNGIVGYFLRHFVPALFDRQAMQFEPEIVEPMQCQDRAVGAG